MPSLNLLSAGRALFYISALILIANMIDLALADSLVNSVNPISSTNLTDQIAAGYYSIPVTDEKGNVHDMIISTVSLDSWFATTTAICPDTPNPNPACGWNPNALYDPTGAVTNGTYCSIGVKSDPREYTECYKIMPNRPISLGTKNAQTQDLQLHADVGLLINSTWDGSHQSGMLGLAATVNKAPAGPWNSILDDMSERYSQPKQFTLGLSRSAKSGGWLTFGSTLPPNALPLDNPAVFQTLMENSAINTRISDLYAVTASVAILNAPSKLNQYVIDSGDVYLRVDPATAQAINSAWNPAGVLMKDGSGRWSLPCNAEAPTIGVTINEHFFNFDKADMLWNQNNVCWSTVVTSPNGPYTLGQPLLKNMIVTFNLDNQYMYFQQGGSATHVPAESSTSAAITAASLASTSTTARTTTAPAVATSSSSTTSTTKSFISPGPSQSSQSSTKGTAMGGVSTFLTSTTSTTVVLSTSFPPA